MTPEDQLCQRVLQLSCSIGVSPAVSAALGAAVARYRSERLHRSGRWWGAISTLLAVSAVGCFGWHGLANLYRMELERGVRPGFAAAIGVLGIAEVAGAVGFAWLARRMFGHWRYFKGSRGS